jgi:adenylyltransferase/sulfurtransferase
VKLIQTLSPELTRADFARHARQLILPELGFRGQARLKAARVLIVGVGGLGCPVALYLAAAGVGQLTLVDPDRIDESNLHRQILFGFDDIGGEKATVAATRLAMQYPGVDAVPGVLRLDRESADAVVVAHDVVVDCSDNLATRYALNAACLVHRKPLVYASIHRYDGQLAVFNDHPHAPCYRCLYPAPPPADAVPSCAEGGVLGVLPGILGSLQAAEVLKLLLGVGTSLSGYLLHLDVLGAESRRFRLPKQPDCPGCSATPMPLPDDPTIAACAMDPVETLTSAELRRRLRSAAPPLLLDVRSPAEYTELHIDGARLLPLPVLEAAIPQLPRNRALLCYCLSGARSHTATQRLRMAGFADVAHLAGGILAYAASAD